MICPEGHNAELETRLTKGEPPVVEVACICEECQKVYVISLYGSAIGVKQLEDPPQPAMGPEPSTPEEPLDEI